MEAKIYDDLFSHLLGKCRFMPTIIYVYSLYSVSGWNFPIFLYFTTFCTKLYKIRYNHIFSTPRTLPPHAPTSKSGGRKPQPQDWRLWACVRVTSPPSSIRPIINTHTLTHALKLKITTLTSAMLPPSERFVRRLLLILIDGYDKNNRNSLI